MRVLITGGGGYIGRFVTLQALASGHEVTVIERSEVALPDGVERAGTDLFEDVAALYERAGRPECCIHLAWQDGFVHNSPAHMANLDKHFDFCAGLLKCGVKRLAVMGTMHEIGYHEGAINAETSCSPTSEYGKAKNILRERVMALMADYPAAKLLWLRAYYILGDDQRSNSVFGKIYRAGVEGQTTFPFTSGRNKYDFITVEELAKQIVACAEQEEFTGVINCASGQPMSLKDRVEQFIRDHQLNITLEFGAFPDRPYDSPGVWADTTIIEEILKRRSL